MASTVCAVLDLEAFQHGPLVRYRELGWITVLDEVMTHLHVNPGRLPFDDPSARRTLGYQKYHVHGLDYYPCSSSTVIHYSRIPNVVNDLYQKCPKTDTQNVVAYKGGSMEKCILNSLHIPNLNLESLPGCLSLSNQVLDASFPDCGTHVHSPVGNFHCARAEVLFYCQWLKSVM